MNGLPASMNSRSKIESAFWVLPLHLRGKQRFRPGKATISSPYQENIQHLEAQPSVFRKQYCPDTSNPIIFAKLHLRLFFRIFLTASLRSGRKGT
jgi:hypothetical protein